MIQPGSTQQTEQEVTSNSVEDDQKNVPEQFDNAQIEEQIAEVEEIQKNEDLSATLDSAVENTEKEIKCPDTDTEAPVNSEETTTADQLDEIDTNNTSKVTINEEDIIPLKTPQAVIEEIENDANKIESTATESAVVEKAAAWKNIAQRITYLEKNVIVTFREYEYAYVIKALCNFADVLLYNLYCKMIFTTNLWDIVGIGCVRV